VSCNDLKKEFSVLSKLNNVLISSEQKSPAPLENNGAYKYRQSFEGGLANGSQEAKGVRATSISTALCAKQLAMSKAAHGTPAWPLSHPARGLALWTLPCVRRLVLGFRLVSRWQGSTSLPQLLPPFPTV